MNIGANTGYFNNLFVGSEDFGSILTSVNISNSGNISTLSLGVGGSASISTNLVVGGALGVTGTTTLGTTNTASISNSGVISTLGLNVGALSSINISTVNLAAGFISTMNIGANTGYFNNLFVGTEDIGSILTSQNITNAGNISTVSISTGSISTATLGVSGNSLMTGNLGIGGNVGVAANVSSFSLNTGNISSASLFSGNITNANTNTSSIQGNTISSGKLYAGAVFYNVQSL